MAEHSFEYEFEDGEMVKGKYSGDAKTDNFVPVTALMYWLLENENFPIDSKRIQRTIKKCSGITSFKPSNKRTYNRARRMVGQLLGIE